MAVRTFPDMDRWAMLRWRALGLGIVIGLAATFGLTAGSAGSVVKSFNYCGHQSAVFNGRHPYLGVSDGSVQAENPRLSDCSLGQMAAHGIGYYRGEINWAGTEYYPGAYNFTGADALVAATARHHIRLLITLIGAPRWQSTDPAVDALDNYPPKNPGQFGHFAALCVQRYGPRGAFWRENRKLPYFPVRAWQIWNEPNFYGEWLPRPNAPAYVRLLQASYRAIKLADRGATVVTGGMPFNRLSEETSFLTLMYRAGVRGYFDALSLHPYSATLNRGYQRLRLARAVMKRFRDARKALWVTEVGWAGGNPNAFVWNPRKQRAQLGQFSDWVLKNRSRLRLQEVFWYGWVDLAVPNGVTDPGWWGYHLGVFTSALQPKPALGALTKTAHRLDR